MPRLHRLGVFVLTGLVFINLAGKCKQNHATSDKFTHTVNKVDKKEPND